MHFLLPRKIFLSEDKYNQIKLFHNSKDNLAFGVITKWGIVLGSKGTLLKTWNSFWDNIGILIFQFYIKVQPRCVLLTFKFPKQTCRNTWVVSYHVPLLMRSCFPASAPCGVCLIRYSLLIDWLLVLTKHFVR